MSYDNLSEEQIRKIADEFAVNVDENADEQTVRNAVSSLPKQEVALSFPEFADALNESDDDDEDDEAPVAKKATAKKTAKKAAVKKSGAVEAEASAPRSKTLVPDEYTLMKMTRNNPIYEVRGYRFDRDRAPYVLVKNADVDYLIEVEGGFAIAKPSEVEAFYN